MTERELSIIRALGEEFSTVLADLQRTFEGKMASQAQAFEEKLTSLSAVLQKHVTVDEVRPVLQAMVDDAVGPFRYRVMVVIMIRMYCSRR
ncbi:Phage portal protein [Escherichia coli O145:H28 str. RM12581]|uniref:Phage portal protein n=1 Tax=Escherichia coli O145:H28 (strain RM12581) TaxID=1248823 RepID=A0ABC7ZQ66_ECOLR|nr:Phage portal protein [Escherichia coli O145:H28 str. RM13514]AHY69952.1 Phage portal protein [Escherichia coli O145:H28 str. RM12581]